MLTKPRLVLLAANLAVLSLAVSLLMAAAPQVPADPALQDAPLAAPGEWFDAQRSVGADAGAYARAIRQSNDNARRTGKAAPDLAGLKWRFEGPSNVGGRVNDVVVDPARSDTIFIAAASGGVWKSTDAATTFSSVWPTDVTPAIGALAIGEDGVLYAGTGEANPGGGSIVYGGTGIYRSTDGGKTWEHRGLRSSGAFGRIAVDPKNSKRIFAAASGNLYVPGGQRGLYLSSDGGDTWKRVLAGDNDTTGAVDISIDPDNPNNILATMWDHARYASHRVYAGPGSALYRSTDGGRTWTRNETVTMPDVDDNGRIGVAFSPADPQRAYAIIANTMAGTFGAHFRSDDGGATWTQLAADGTLSGNQSSFGWWFSRIYPDPDEVDRVFITGVELTASLDGGETFLPQSGSTAGLVSPNQTVVHADQHAMAWDPKVPGRVYLGNDGGVYRSDNDGHGVWVGGLEQGWTQHYSVDVGEQTPGYIVTGMQDNRCQRNAPAPVAGRPDTWTSYGLCGDGLATLINPVDETVTYGCSQYGGCGRSRLGVADPQFSRPPGPHRWGWFAPLEFDPNDPSIMYFGSNKVSRSTNGGTNWTVISEDLADPDGTLEQLDPHQGYRIRGVVTTIAPAGSDADTLYAGTDTGYLWVTRDQGETWTQLEDPTLPATWVTRVAVDPADADVAYVTYSSYRDGSDAAHVAKTTDGGATWTNISTDLPDAPVNDIVVTGEALAVATDVGVFLSRDGGDEWHRVGSNLPTVPVIDLRYHEGSSTLTAATFGFGIQRVALP